MATSGSFSATVASAVPEGFHYETKHIVLTYLGMLPVSRSQTQEDPQNESERIRMIKDQIEDELRQLEDEMAASFSTTGFDRHSSPVFSPTFEDCLSVMGERVVGELDTSLAAAVQSLLSGDLDYQRFRDTTVDLSKHTAGGWSKVLVPLVLLQALHSEGQSVTTLLHLGVRLLEEDEADYVIQQGGWCEIFRLGSEAERGVTIAEDNNDIYILSGDPHPDQLSPPSSLLCAGDNSSGQSSWQTESLPVSLAGHESWAQVVAMDPEDLKSLDSNDGAALVEERSENNSSNSDIVHVEREEAELLEEGGDVGAIDESMMSVLGTESELAELREEFRDQNPLLSEVGSEASAPASLISLEDPVVIETPASLSAEPAAEPELPPLVAEAAAPPPPPSPPPPPPAEPEPVVEHPPAADPEPEPAAAPVPPEVAHPPLTSEAAEVTSDAAPSPEQGSAPEPESEPETGAEPALVPLAGPEAPLGAPAEEPPVQPEPASEFPALLYGGAALLALAAVVTYSIIRYRRK